MPSDLAIAGSPPDYHVPALNIFSYLFSNPFVKGSHGQTVDPVKYHGHDLEAPTRPQKAAFIDGETGASITFDRLQQDAKCVAASLRGQLGLHPAPYTPGTLRDPIISPVVLLHLPNCIPFVVLELAGWAAGLTVTTVNNVLKPDELAHVIRESRPSVIFTTPGGAGLDVINKALKIVGDKELSARLYDGRTFIVDPQVDDYGASTIPAKYHDIGKIQDWKTLLKGDGNKFVVDEYKNGEDESKRRTSLILWSSGTSGKSKGVVIPNSYLTYGMKLVWLGNRWYTGDEVFIGVAPFFHIFGLSNIMLLSIIIGGTTICLPKFDPKIYLSCIQKYKATYLHIAPPLGIFLAKSPLVAAYDLSSVKSSISGGAPLGDAVIEAVYKRLGFWIRMSYGTSEGASTSMSSALTWEEAKTQLTATGIPYPGIEVKIVDTDGSGRIMKRGERGELVFQSPSLLNCYLNNEAATTAAFDEDGWYRTGDVGIIDENDNVYIVDRLKEVIKVKGFQVAPAELEGLLNSIEGVADAGVTGIFVEAEQTEYPKAYVVPSTPALLQHLSIAAEGRYEGKPHADLVAFVKGINAFIEQKTSHYKRLKGGIVLCPAIPKSNSGKILRKDFGTVKGLHINLYEQPAGRESKL